MGIGGCTGAEGLRKELTEMRISVMPILPLAEYSHPVLLPVLLQQ